jgi:hypothetical protein
MGKANNHYMLGRVPKGRSQEELQVKLNLFDSHVDILSDKGRHFHAQWLSENGSVQINPAYDSKRFIVQVRNPEDREISINYVSIPTDMRVRVCGQDYHVFFR